MTSLNRLIIIIIIIIIVIIIIIIITIIIIIILREEIAVFARNLLKIAHHPSLLEGYTSCRLIPLDKNPGIRPIGVGEVLRRIVGKAIAGFLKKEIKEAAGSPQVCVGNSAGA